MIKINFTKSTIFITALIFVFLSGSLFAQLKKNPEIETKIEILQTAYKASDALTVKLTFTNTSAKTIRFLNWNTGFDGFNANIFRIIKNNEPVMYIGRVVKRGNPRAEDYVTLNAKESKSVTLNLAEAYAIYDISSYSVQYHAVLLDYGSDTAEELSLNANKNVTMLESVPVSINISEKREPVKRSRMQEANPNYIGCSDGEKKDLQKALEKAGKMAQDAQKEINNTDPSDKGKMDHYVKWFGTYTETRGNTVKTNFNAIVDALVNKTITFNCDQSGCGANWFAYVKPNEPYIIYLCSQFWKAPMEGDDSKAGTLIHEISHFYVVAGTGDYAYGHDACKKLAKDNPDLAVENADSYEYFAETLKSGVEFTYQSILLIFLMAMAYVIYQISRRGFIKKPIR